MTPLQKVRLVTVREVRERVRSKSFWNSTAVSLAMILALAILPGVLADDGPTTFQVGVDDPETALAERLTQGGIDPAGAAGPPPGQIEVEVEVVDAVAEAERLVTAGDLDAALMGNEVVVDQELDDQLGLLLAEAQRQVDIRASLAEAGVGDDVARRVLDPEPLAVRALDPPDAQASDRQALTFLGTILLFGQIFGFGFWVASGVVEEKSSRVVELLLAKARPSELLTGKIIGLGVIGFVQLLAFVAIGLSAASAAGSVELPPETLRVAAEVLAWFVLGFAVYSCLFAMGGALASRAEEMQNTTAPISFLAMAGFLAAVNANGNPDGVVAKVASFLPPAAPMVMPIRSAAGEVALWEVVLSVGLVLVSLVGIVWLAARVYAGGALKLRGQLKLRQALARE